MSYKEMAKRLERLEAQAGYHDVIYAVHLVDIGQVEIFGTGERLPLAAFKASYPTGQIALAAWLWMWEAL